MECTGTHCKWIATVTFCLRVDSLLHDRLFLNTFVRYLVKVLSLFSLFFFYSGGGEGDLVGWGGVGCEALNSY